MPGHRKAVRAYGARQGEPQPGPAFDAQDPTSEPNRGASPFSFTVRKVSAPVASFSRRAPDLWVLRRLRIMVRLLRVDTPALWRIAAHGAVLVLCAGVLLISQLLSAEFRAGAPSQDDHITEWARQASSFIPNTVVQTSSAGGNLGASADAIPGFVSPGAIAEADQSLLPWDKPETHALKAGETLSSIAAAYGIEPLWLLWTNPEIQKNPHNVAVGTELTVLPMKAVVHVVKDGESVAALAEKYKAKAEDITGYTTNQLVGGAMITPGMRLIVPDGESSVTFPSLPGSKGTLPARTVQSWASPGGGAPAVGSGNFHAATYGRLTTRYRRGHLGVDLANHTGTPIYAIDGGTVVIAGWWSWAGKAVKIDHGNGYASLYAHMNTINVSPGQSVQPGQVIGAIGCTRGRGGYCSGPHLHLEVYFQGRYVNPCSLGGVCY
jgi:murein DD-endopeptidase MepM/ murein hydrolase activator NlpD